MATPYRVPKDYPLKKSRFYTHLDEEARKIDKEYFNGKLKGKVDYAWAKDLGPASGLTTHGYVDHTFRNRPLVTLSKKTKRAEGDASIKSTLAHEMVHAYQNLYGKRDEENMGHGKHFFEKAEKINKKLPNPKEHIKQYGVPLSADSVNINYARDHFFVQNTHSKSVISSPNGHYISDDHPQYEGEGYYKNIEHNNYADFKKMMSNKLPSSVGNKIRLKVPLSQFKPSEKVKQEVKNSTDLKKTAISQWTSHFKNHLSDVKGIQLEAEKPLLKLLKEERETYSNQAIEFEKANAERKIDKELLLVRNKLESQKQSEKLLKKMENYQPKPEDDPVEVEDRHIHLYQNDNGNRIFGLAPKKGQIVKNPLNGKGWYSHEDSLKYRVKRIAKPAAIEVLSKDPNQNNFANYKKNRHDSKIEILEDRIGNMQKSYKYLANQNLQSKDFDELDKVYDKARTPLEGTIKRTKSGLKQNISNNEYYKLFVSGPGETAQRREKERTQNAVDIQYTLKKLEKHQKANPPPPPASQRTTGQKRQRKPPKSVISQIVAGKIVDQQNNSNNKRIKKEE